MGHNILRRTRRFCVRVEYVNIQVPVHGRLQEHKSQLPGRYGFQSGMKAFIK